MSAIHFANVSKTFGRKLVLKDFNMKVQYAKTTVILGGSGSGKSTILKLALGLLKPDSGKISVFGKDITNLGEEDLGAIRKKIGMVFQTGALFDSLSVGENVAYQMRESHTYDDGEIKQTVLALLKLVGLERTFDKFPSELSGGMQRRVSIARALVGNPPIILYDSPTGGLDPITGRNICELVMKLRDLEGVASIFVTHDLKSAMTLANEFAEKKSDGRIIFKKRGATSQPANTRFFVMRNGGVCFEGTYEQLRESRNEYIIGFLT